MNVTSGAFSSGASGRLSFSSIAWATASFVSGFTRDRSSSGPEPGGGNSAVRRPNRKWYGTNVGSSRGVSALYHSSSQGLSASRRVFPKEASAPA